MKCIHAGLAISALLGATICGATETPSGPEILTGDVDRFFRIFDAADGRPTAEQLQRDYLDAGSEGLKHLAKLRNVTGVRIADKLATDPALYEKARQCTRVLPQARAAVEAHREPIPERQRDASGACLQDRTGLDAGTRGQRNSNTRSGCFDRTVERGHDCHCFRNHRPLDWP